jgi:hypothetical protein
MATTIKLHLTDIEETGTGVNCVCSQAKTIRYLFLDCRYMLSFFSVQIAFNVIVRVYTLGYL